MPTPPHEAAPLWRRHVSDQECTLEGRINLVCIGTPLLDIKPDRTMFKPIAPPQPGDFQVGSETARVCKKG